jgi:hypothetical protein
LWLTQNLYQQALARLPEHSGWMLYKVMTPSACR